MYRWVIMGQQLLVLPSPHPRRSFGWQVWAQEKKNFQVLHMYCIFAYKFHKDTPFIEVNMNISPSPVRTILGKMPWGGPVTTGI